MFPFPSWRRSSPPPFSGGTDWCFIGKVVLAICVPAVLFMSPPWGWYVLGVLLTLVGLFVLASIAYMLYQLVRTDYADWFSRPRTSPAAFVRKFERSLEVGLPLGGGEDLFGNAIPSPLDNLLWTHWIFWAVFQVGDQELEFRLPKDAYIELEEGMTGLLTYQGERFLRFKPMSLAAGPDETRSSKRDQWKLGSRLPRGRPPDP